MKFNIKHLFVGTCLICSCTAEPVVNILDNGMAVVYAVLEMRQKARLK